MPRTPSNPLRSCSRAPQWHLPSGEIGSAFPCARPQSHTSRSGSADLTLPGEALAECVDRHGLPTLAHEQPAGLVTGSRTSRGPSGPTWRGNGRTAPPSRRLVDVGRSLDRPEIEHPLHRRRILHTPPVTFEKDDPPLPARPISTPFERTNIGFLLPYDRRRAPYVCKLLHHACALPIRQD